MELLFYKEKNTQKFPAIIFRAGRRARLRDGVRVDGDFVGITT